MGLTDAVVEVFWRHGYEGASVGMLIEAMGIGIPSLYAAFANKDELFRKAVERYDEKYGKLFRTTLEEPTARRVFASLIRAAIVQATRPRRPDGCLLTSRRRRNSLRSGRRVGNGNALLA
ncbi:TetR/AcrR family transcriptional regulator [Bradyrhizobium sp. UFLA 03-164]|uniref:TetR/AcrR family transcriptional regulator n=1 Tax=Bradyrhizobium uaiense TaxID=2594946 RepID=A0A6P1BHN7_9BRAD|nr:TetR/AcrR family transcriptional regulator [Bradyrhizobium uaiense]